MNGKYKGMRLDDLINIQDEKLLGSRCNNEQFPLLVKLINSKEKLSVQVHPNDEYASKYENQSAKTEAWYVLDAKPGVQLIIGTNGCNKDDFKKYIENDEVEGYSKVILCESEYFIMEKYEVDTSVKEISNAKKFTILTCMDGNGKIVIIRHILSYKKYFIRKIQKIY